MPLPFLYQAPMSLPDFRRFSYWHAADHTEIQQAIQKQKSIQLVSRVLDPIDLSALDIWIELHQQTHNDVNQALGLNGQDLTDFELKDAEKLKEWVYSNAQEHLALRQTLGI